MYKYFTDRFLLFVHNLHHLAVDDKESITTLPLHCLETWHDKERGGKEENFIPGIVFRFTYFRIVDPNHRSDIDKALKWKFGVWGR